VINVLKIIKTRFMQFLKDIKSPRHLMFFLSAIICTLSLASCKKYLDEKRSQDQAVPSTLADLQALMDNNNNWGSSPGYLEFVADNYYLSSGSWNGAQLMEWRTNYVWSKEAKVEDNIWSQPYSVVYYSNLVLEYLPKVKKREFETELYDAIKGTALFYRSFMFHQLAQLFCQPYSTSSDKDLGIVVRTTSAIEAHSTRATVQQTYDQVVSDLKTATQLLPLNTVVPTRPSKTAAYGLLARVFLSMRDYVNAGKYADTALSLNNSLLDYNQYSPDLPNFTNNPEIHFFSEEGYAPFDLLGPSNCKIDSNLFQSYQVNDLRRSIFFGSNGNTYYWWGSYFSSYRSSIFDGIATDEIYLIRAECLARAGNKDEAMNDLNTLLIKRWKTGTYTNSTASDAQDALNKILTERRKELLFRGLRWSDLRRFNLENANVTLTRIINGTTYTLPPNDLRWVLAIPDAEINRSGMPQNPR
jgi:starch-binding outer membrane protein, SusD/RagB family